MKTHNLFMCLLLTTGLLLAACGQVELSVEGTATASPPPTDATEQAQWSNWIAGTATALRLTASASTSTFTPPATGTTAVTAPPATQAPPTAIAASVTPVAAAPTPIPQATRAPANTPTLAPPIVTPTAVRTATPLPLALSASPAQIRPGESITLRWSVPQSDMAGYGYGLSLSPIELAERSDLSRYLGWNPLQFSIDNPMPATGSIVISSSTELNYVATQLEFQLSLWSKPPGQATSILGVVTTTVQIVGQPVCAETWFFTNPPSGVCPDQPPIYSNAAVQRFEHGQMIWVEATDVFYIFLNPAAGESKGRFYRFAVPLALKPGASVDNRTGETPPPGLHEPVSGFGLLWRGEVDGAENVRAALGWAVQPEYAYSTTVQCEVQLTSSWSCYLLDPYSVIVNYYSLYIIGSFWAYW